MPRIHMYVYIKVATACARESSDQSLHLNYLITIITVVPLCIFIVRSSSLRKHPYSNILKILPLKKENFQIENSDIFHISAQNIDCGYSLEPPRRGSSNEYPQSMF